MSSVNQHEIDSRNSRFWNELCGTQLAQSLGIVEATPENLIRFDQTYLSYYPYLSGYVLREKLKQKTVLEVGLGFGTLGQFIAEQGASYSGLDVAASPVAMMQYRLQMLSQNSEGRVQQGSALSIPYAANSLDFVYSIGCLHHTGNIALAVQEIYRVLKPGGKAIIMLYNRHSYRQFCISIKRLVSRKSSAKHAEQVRGKYDINSAGRAAPHTEFLSRSDIKHFFKDFSTVRIDCQNFDTYSLLHGRLLLSRDTFLNNIARVFGLDWYIVAQK